MMNFKISRNIRLTSENIIMDLLLLLVFVIQWLGHSFYYMVIVDCAFLLYIIANKKQLYKSRFMLLTLVIFVFYCLLNLLISNVSIITFLNNLYVVISSVFIVIGTCSLLSNIEKIEECYKKVFNLINGYMILNIPVLILQLNDHFELSGRHLGEHTNNYKPDLISGLFGYNGTPMLAAFSAFFFIYDLWYFRKYTKKKNKIKFLIYYFSMLFFYLYISIPNDNKGFYIILGLFYVLYYLTVQANCTKLLNRIRGFWKGICISIIALVAFLYAYNHYPPLVVLVERLLRVFNTGLRSNYAYGGAERIAIINYFFSRDDISKIFGNGIGLMRWREEMGFGFYHFGQNDLGPFLLLGGILFIVLLFAIFYSSVSSVNKHRFISICECVCLAVFILYTQVFTSFSIMISLMLFIGVCVLESRDDKQITFRSKK